MSWSIKYDKCQNCGTTERKHCAKGLCKICWEKQHYINNPDKRKRVAAQKKAAAILKKNGERKWAKDFDACVCCGLTKFLHKGKGLCKSCSWKNRYADPIFKQKCLENSHQSYREHIDKRRAYDKKRRECRYFDNKRNTVLDRDGHKCCVCGFKDDLVVHHTDGHGSNTDHPNNDLNNLQTLCHACHSSIHARIIGWAKKYTCCIVCGKTDRVHSGHGRCVTCAAFFRRKQRENVVI
jgi:hypothetical protein